MKALSKLFILFVLFTGSVSCLTTKKVPPSTNVSQLTPGSGIKEGSLVYSLPMTVLTVKFDLERIIEVPGPYSKYAGDLLGLNKVIMSEREYWSVKGIHVSSHQEADPSEYYVIKSNTAFETNALAMKKEGLILDLNPSLYGYGKSQVTETENDMTDFQTFDMGSNEYFKVQRDTAYRRVGVDSTFIRIPYLLEKKKRLTADQLAEKAAARLIEIREGKVLILTGESNVFPQNEAAINELNRLEKEYTELFAGRRWKETRSLTFQLIPRKEMIGNQVSLFRLSEEAGPLTGKEPGGIPVNITFVPEQKTKDLTIINGKEAAEKTDTEQPEPDKIFYRVPDVVNVNIKRGDETLYNSRTLIYQLGKVLPLPSNYIIGK